MRTARLNRESPEMSGIHEYEISLEGYLDDRWADRFEGMTMSSMQDGLTHLIGEVSDQSALHGILARIRDLGLVLVSVKRV